MAFGCLILLLISFLFLLFPQYFGFPSVVDIPDMAGVPTVFSTRAVNSVLMLLKALLLLTSVMTVVLLASTLLQCPCCFLHSCWNWICCCCWGPPVVNNSYAPGITTVADVSSDVCAPAKTGVPSLFSIPAVVLHSAVETGGKFVTVVVVSGGKFATSISGRWKSSERFNSVQFYRLLLVFLTSNIWVNWLFDHFMTLFCFYVLSINHG